VHGAKKEVCFAHRILGFHFIHFCFLLMVLNDVIFNAIARFNKFHSIGIFTRRKLCHMQPAKERLRVIYNSYTTKQLKICINHEVYQGVDVF
jgi:hypothetical protein